MTQVEFLQAVTLNGVTYRPGARANLPSDLVVTLRRCGVVRDLEGPLGSPARIRRGREHGDPVPRVGDP